MIRLCKFMPFVLFVSMFAGCQAEVKKPGPMTLPDGYLLSDADVDNARSKWAALKEQVGAGNDAVWVVGEFAPGGGDLELRWGRIDQRFTKLTGKPSFKLEADGPQGWGKGQLFHIDADVVKAWRYESHGIMVRSWRGAPDGDDSEGTGRDRAD